MPKAAETLACIGAQPGFGAAQASKGTAVLLSPEEGSWHQEQQESTAAVRLMTAASSEALKTSPGSKSEAYPEARRPPARTSL